MVAENGKDARSFAVDRLVRGRFEGMNRGFTRGEIVSSV